MFYGEGICPSSNAYKCQSYGRIAKFCKGKQRCGKCGGDHEYDQFGSEVIKGSNCGGGHTAAYGGCPARKRAVVVQQVRAEKKPVNKECEGISTE